MHKPKVVICTSASVDGRVAVSPEVLLLWGDERWPTAEGPNDLHEWLHHTHKPQATLEGSGSFVREVDEPSSLPPADADPEALYRDFLPESVIQHPDHKGWFTVVDGRGRGRDWMKDGAVFGPAWAGWHLLILAGRHTPPEYLAYLRSDDIPYLVAGQGQVDLRLALEKLGSRLGVETLLSTAGGRLSGALLRAGLVDEINLEFFPAVIGGFDTPSLFDSPALKPDEQPVGLTLLSAQVLADGRVWLRYGVAAA